MPVHIDTLFSNKEKLELLASESSGMIERITEALLIKLQPILEDAERWNQVAKNARVRPSTGFVYFPEVKLPHDRTCPFFGKEAADIAVDYILELIQEEDEDAAGR